MRPGVRFRTIAIGLGAAVLVTAASSSATAGRLFAWRAESETATVTMCGSIHFGRPEFYPLSPSLEQAYASADALAVEIDVFSPQAMLETANLVLAEGMLPDGRTLAEVLPDSLDARLREILADRPGMYGVYRKLKPAFAAVALAAEEYQKLGFDPALGLESHFLEKARDRKPIRELESLRQQMSLFTALDEELGILFLEATLQQVQDQGPLLDELVAAWRDGDAAGVDSLMTSQVGEDPRLQDFYRRLLDDRNLAMADSVDAWLRADRDVFMLVGAAHYPGPRGIVALLEERGWDVSQLRD